MQLNRDPACCDTQQLEDYLNASLDDAVAADVESHLSTCHACRKYLEQTAFSQEEWQRTQSLLRRDDLDDASVELQITHGPEDEDSGHNESAMLSREIQGWLDPTDDPAMLGRFAGYEILGVIGHGGMGIVLKGFESSLNRYVAIKILAPRLATNGTARKRFAREARAAAAVLHENVIAIHRVDEWHGLPFLVMPYIGGISLQKRIDDEGPLSIDATLRVGVQIAAGLAAAHEQGLVHRDIKPANILLDRGVERVTITDFGLARAADDASMTRTGIIAGTPQYMSPEQADAKAIDARSDLFSLGSVLYTMAAGRPPFRGEGSFEVLKRVGDEQARPLHELDASIPVWFDNLVAQLLEKSADDRPQSAIEVHRLLSACLLFVTQPDQTLPKELTMRRRPVRRRRWTLAAIAIAVVILSWFMFPPLQIGGNAESSSLSGHFIRRTAVDNQARIHGELAANQQLVFQIEESIHNKAMDWKTKTKAGPFTVIVTRTSVPTGSGTSAPGFTYQIVNDESGGGAMVNTACSAIDPLPNATIHFEMVKPEERELRGPSPINTLRIATLKYPDGTEATVTLLIRAAGNQIATVLGEPIYEGDMQPHLSDKDNFHRLLITPLMEHYCKQQGIDRAKELDERIKDPQSRYGAELFVNRWELQRHLYKKYGGRVVLDAFGSIAVDGYRKWIEERKQFGDFTITDPELQTRFDAMMKVGEGERYASLDQIKDAFDPAITERFIEQLAKVPAGAYSDPDLKLIGVVLGNPVYLHQRYLKNTLELPELLKSMILDPLEKHYRQQHPELEPTEAEIDRLSVFTRRNTVSAIAVYQQRLASVNEKIRQADEGSTLHGNLTTEQAVIEDKLKRMRDDDGRALAMLSARPFKFQKHLFDAYGGGRILLRPKLIAFDAQRKWVEERERLGEFQIADAELRTKFYDTWDKGSPLHGNSLTDDPKQVKAAFGATWLAQSAVKDTLMRPSVPAGEVGRIIAIQQAQRIPASKREFPAEEVAQLIAQVKKEDDLAKTVTQLRRITGLDFGDCVEPQSRCDWLEWWQCERDCIDNAAVQNRPFIIVGIVKDDQGKTISGASIQVQVPFMNSATGQYMLAHTKADHSGQYVLAFGLPPFATLEMESLQATISVVPTPLHQLPETEQPITLQLPITEPLLDETATQQKDWLRPNKLRSINFVMQLK